MKGLRIASIYWFRRWLTLGQGQTDQGQRNYDRILKIWVGQCQYSISAYLSLGRLFDEWFIRKYRL
jgi:hypothetical protein